MLALFKEFLLRSEKEMIDNRDACDNKEKHGIHVDLKRCSWKNVSQNHNF